MLPLADGRYCLLALGLDVVVRCRNKPDVSVYLGCLRRLLHHQAVLLISLDGLCWLNHNAMPCLCDYAGEELCFCGV